jgi:hypothetical protein
MCSTGRSARSARAARARAPSPSSGLSSAAASAAAARSASACRSRSRSARSSASSPGCRCDRLDAGHHVGQVRGQPLDVTQLALERRPLPPGLSQHAPGLGHGGQARRLRLAEEPVEERPLHGRPRQRAGLVLGDDADQPLPRPLERLPRGRPPGGQRATAPGGRDPAGEHERVLVGGHELAHTREGVVLEVVRPERERRLHVGLAARRSDDAAVGPGAQDQAERPEQDRLACARLAR